MGDEPIYDNPGVRDHIAAYLTGDGRAGHDWRGRPSLLLTTRGRKSGVLRRTPLIYGRDGDTFLVVASNDGSSSHPHWYHNLVANPDVVVQVGPDQFAARARTAAPDEKPRLWAIMAAIFPRYDRYQAETPRDIPLVVLEPV